MIEPGCAIERLAVNVSNPQLAQPLREATDRARARSSSGVQPAQSLFELLGCDGDL